MMPSLTFEYKFNAQEVAALARFLRAHVTEVPDELSNFSRAVENTVYDQLSVQEAQRFYGNMTVT